MVSASAISIISVPAFWMRLSRPLESSNDPAANAGITPNAVTSAALAAYLGVDHETASVIVSSIGFVLHQMHLCGAISVLRASKVIQSAPVDTVNTLSPSQSTSSSSEDLALHGVPMLNIRMHTVNMRSRRNADFIINKWIAGIRPGPGVGRSKQRDKHKGNGR